MNSILTRGGRVGVVFACALLLVVSASAQLSLRKALDFDNDNKADFSVFRPSNNVWYIKGSAGGFISQAFGVANTDFQTPGDYDGDGKSDIAVWRDTDGVWYRINSSNNTFSAIPFGTTGDEPVARDFDGDGKTDQAVVRRTGGAMIWYVLKSTTGTLSAVQFGLDTDYTAPGDYDGDGKFDLAVQRPGTTQGIFYILQSSNNSVLTVPWGNSSDTVVPGDYDGDGKTDIAVVREGSTPNSPLNWYIRLSSLAGTAGEFRAVAFGLTGSDLNTQADYDGDGKTDISVWRDSNGTFYVLRSSDGAVSGTNWGTANDFPIASFDTH